MYIAHLRLLHLYLFSAPVSVNMVKFPEFILVFVFLHHLQILAFLWFTNIGPHGMLIYA